MSNTPTPTPTPRANTESIITALGNAYKTQTGEPLQSDRIAQLLIQNMGQLSELAKQGKLNQSQILQLKEYADKHKAGGSGSTAAASAPGPSSNPGPFRTANTPYLQSAPKTETYPVSGSLTPTSTTPVQWPAAQQGRATLTAGIAAGRMSGTPALISKPSDDPSLLSTEDNRTRRKSTPGDQSMRRSILDLVYSIDPNVKLEPEVEDLMLDIADEFVDSVTNFACRLAKHRGADTLDVKDLQLHLERNHNIRIPGFASDETRISLSQTTTAPAVPIAGTAKKGAQGTQSGPTSRSQRLAQVAMAKKEAKLV